MVKKDKRIDAVIVKAAEFAQPILTHLRKLVHTACPDAEETIKWGMPNFLYNGKILCNMAAFKEHCAFNFWNASLMSDPDGVLQTVGKTSMGHLGRITKLSDLPSDKVMLKYLKDAMKLTDAGVKKVKPAAKANKTLTIPDYFKKALAKNKKAQEVFENFSYSHKKEYVEWISEAKTEETRTKRIATTLQWLEEGKGRNWKYEKK